MSISHIKKQAKLSLQGNWGLCVLLTFIIFLVNFILPSIIEIIFSGGWSSYIYQDEAPSVASFASYLISIILMPFSVAVNWFYLSIVRQEQPKITQVFEIYKDGKTSLKLIGATILQGILLFLWTLLLIIPGIIKSMSYSQTFFILRDHPEYSVLEAITESRKRMDGLKGDYFLLGLSFIGWGILCLFTLGIGFLWLTPYVSASLANFYDKNIALKGFEI